VTKRKFKLRVNGKRWTVLEEPEEHLLWVLRDSLGLTGTKFGCGEGICGACSVLVDGRARRSCLLPVSLVAQGQKIVTIEGLKVDGKLTPLQRAFIDYTAFGCGFCTPGMIINATALLIRNSSPSQREIIEAMNGNLCRCGSYPAVIKAIASLVERGWR